MQEANGTGRCRFFCCLIYRNRQQAGSHSGRRYAYISRTPQIIVGACLQAMGPIAGMAPVSSYSIDKPQTRSFFTKGEKGRLRP